MALGTPTLVTPAVQGSSTCTTANFTPTAGAVLFACMAARRGGSAPGVASFGDSIGLTWTVIAQAVFNDGTDPRVRAAVAWAVAGSSPPAMKVTALAAGAGGATLQVVQVTGAKLDFSNFGVGTDDAGAPVATLANSPAATSLLLGFGAFQSHSAIATPSGLTELDEYLHTTTDITGEVAYDASSPGDTVTWAGTGQASAAIAWEVPLFTGGAFARATWR